MRGAQGGAECKAPEAADGEMLAECREKTQGLPIPRPRQPWASYITLSPHSLYYGTGVMDSQKQFKSLEMHEPSKGELPHPQERFTRCIREVLLEESRLASLFYRYKSLRDCMTK